MKESSKLEEIMQNQKVERRDSEYYFNGKNNDESFREAKELQEDLFNTLPQQKEETKETNKAAQLLVNQRFDEAIKAYMDLCEKYSHSRGLFESQIGAAYFFKDDFETAVEYYLKSMEHGYSDSADYNLWEAYEILYKQSKDIGYIKKYLRLFPNGDYVQQANNILENSSNKR